MDSKTEAEILHEFKERVKNLGISDDTLKRYLRARNFDLTAAEVALENTLKWRQQNNLDQALTWNISDSLSQTFHIEYPGLDFKNRVVIYGETGSWPLRAWVDAGREEEMLQYLYMSLEKLMQKIDNTSSTQFVMISDLEHLNYWDCAHYQTLQLVMKAFRIFEAHYPERLAEAFIINAPAALNFIWPLLKPLVNKTTLAKLSFLGTNEKVYIPALLERMPKSSLPVKLRKILKNEQAVKQQTGDIY